MSQHIMFDSCVKYIQIKFIDECIYRYLTEEVLLVFCHKINLDSSRYGKNI